jgi:hypothetical protein
MGWQRGNAGVPIGPNGRRSRATGPQPARQRADSVAEDQARGDCLAMSSIPRRAEPRSGQNARHFGWVINLTVSLALKFKAP